MAAERVGKESALLVLSGTMGNLVAILTLARNGDALLAEKRSHIVENEAGHVAGVCGVFPRVFDAGPAAATPAAVEAAQLPDLPHHPRPTLLCLENTHNAAGGVCVTASETRALAEVARRMGLHVHIDGARIFNAETATGDNAAALAAPADTLTFCLTKGLGAPVGSLLCGPRDVIERARRSRQMVGGAMRQAGVFAAAGIVALEHGIPGLAADHANAQILAGGLARFGLSIDQSGVETNIVYVQVPDSVIPPSRLASRLRALGVLVNEPKGNRFRFVLHRHISRADVERTIEILGTVLSN